jgi:hypothetical protein
MIELKITPEYSKIIDISKIDTIDFEKLPEGSDVRISIHKEHLILGQWRVPKKYADDFRAKLLKSSDMKNKLLIENTIPSLK